MNTYFVEMKVCFTYFVKYSLTYVYAELSELYVFLRIVQKFRDVFTLQNFGIGQTDRFFKMTNNPKWFFYFYKWILK
jgi:hypothetical protein